MKVQWYGEDGVEYDDGGISLLFMSQSRVSNSCLTFTMYIIRSSLKEIWFENL